MPPAVEPGLPPMNMSMTVSSFEASESRGSIHAVKSRGPWRHGREEAHQYLLAEGHVAFMRPRSMKKKSSAPRR